MSFSPLADLQIPQEHARGRVSPFGSSLSRTGAVFASENGRLFKEGSARLKSEISARRRGEGFINHGYLENKPEGMRAELQGRGSVDPEVLASSISFCRCRSFALRPTKGKSLLCARQMFSEMLVRMWVILAGEDRGLLKKRTAAKSGQGSLRATNFWTATGNLETVSAI